MDVFALDHDKNTTMQDKLWTEASQVGAEWLASYTTNMQLAWTLVSCKGYS